MGIALAEHIAPEERMTPVASHIRPFDIARRLRKPSVEANTVRSSDHGTTLDEVLRRAGHGPAGALRPESAVALIVTTIDAFRSRRAPHVAARTHIPIDPVSIRLRDDGTVGLPDGPTYPSLGVSSVRRDQASRQLSPEQLLGRPVDERCEVYRLGLLLYRLSTGTTPFAYVEPERLVHAICASEIANPSQHVPGYPYDLEIIVLRSIAVSPDARFEGVTAFATRLHRWLRSRGELDPRSRIAALVRGEGAPRRATASSPPAAPTGALRSTHHDWPTVVRRSDDLLARLRGGAVEHHR